MLHPGDIVNMFWLTAYTSLYFKTHRYYILLPAIETTDVIRNTEIKQVKRNIGRYFQHNFMLFTTYDMR